jgi:acyl-CoA synthetase (AMP-forming)/AMP-acid ligase II
MNLPVPDTLDGFVSYFAARQPDAELCVFGGFRMTYAKAEAAIAGLAGRLVREGLKQGDRVGVLSTPRPEYLLLLNAILRAGGIYVGLNPRHAPAEVAHAIALTEPVRIVALRQAMGLDLAALARDGVALSGRNPAITLIDGPADLAPDGADPIQLSPHGPQDVAVIVFTSGTTGKPKGAALHHSGLIQSAICQYEHLATDGQRLLSNLPINHVGCILNLTYGAICGGGALIFQEKFDPAEALALIARERINTWLQVPAMFQMAVSLPEFALADLSSLRAICAGGGALPAPVLTALRKTGARLYVEYGQTEVMSTLAFADHGASDEDLTTSIGRFDPRFDVRIADEQNEACPPGVAGEIQARGDCVMKGYWNDPAATEAAFTSDGWLKTGDLAAMRPDGLVEIKGRLKEMIKSGGYNLYPREIEMVIERVDEVAAVVVIGLPDPVFGEAAHAVVSVRPGAVPTAAGLKDACRRQLANYKTPRSFRRLDDLPRLPNGKIDRNGLKAIAAGLPELP